MLNGEKENLDTSKVPCAFHRLHLQLKERLSFSPTAGNPDKAMSQLEYSFVFSGKASLSLEQYGLLLVLAHILQRIVTIFKAPL